MSNRVGTDEAGEPIYAWEVPLGVLALAQLPSAAKGFGEACAGATSALAELASFDWRDHA